MSDSGRRRLRHAGQTLSWGMALFRFCLTGLFALPLLVLGLGALAQVVHGVLVPGSVPGLPSGLLFCLGDLLGFALLYRFELRPLWRFLTAKKDEAE